MQLSLCGVKRQKPMLQGNGFQLIMRVKSELRRIKNLEKYVMCC